jgi:hypothetical protein
MDRNFRKLTIEQIIKQAGILYDIVDSSIKSKDSINSLNKDSLVKYSATIPLSYGAQAIIPETPLLPDGSFNVMFQFRYLASTVKNFGNSGIKTVIVTADVKDVYGNPSFITDCIRKVTGYLKQKNPTAHLKNYGLSGFSGGYSVIENLLAKESELKSQIGKEPDAVILLDGGHTRLNDQAMKGFTEYAKQASDPNSGKKFITVHSAIKGEDYKGGQKRTYTSTTDHTNYILNKLDLKRQQVQNPNQFSNWNLKPKSIAQEGGFTAIQADDNAARPYNAVHPDKEGTAGWVHNEIARTLPLVWNQYLQDWNH